MKTRTLLLVAPIALSACGAPLASGADFDPARPIPTPATFAWEDPGPFPTGDPRFDDNPFFERRLHAAVERQLAALGIRRVDAAAEADLLVHHHAAVRDRVDVVQADRAAGYTSYDPEYDAQVYRYEEGTFLVDVADAKSKQLVWRGWAQTDLAGALGDDAELEALIERAVAKMFERFPAAARNAGRPRTAVGGP